METRVRLFVILLSKKTNEGISQFFYLYYSRRNKLPASSPMLQSSWLKQ
jgi:hypothetical protein